MKKMVGMQNRSNAKLNGSSDVDTAWREAICHELPTTDAATAASTPTNVLWTVLGAWDMEWSEVVWPSECKGLPRPGLASVLIADFPAELDQQISSTRSPHLRNDEALVGAHMNPASLRRVNVAKSKRRNDTSRSLLPSGKPSTPDS